MQLLAFQSISTPRPRSFVRRDGRRRKRKNLIAAWEELWPVYGLSLEDKGLLDLEDLFARPAETVIEIGFGDGQALLQMAINVPEKNFIGIDVYRTGASNLLLEIKKHRLSNIRLFCADAVEVLEQKIPDHALSGIQIFFPDPWPKTRHHKRRLVQPDFIALAARKLKENGFLHLATDWMDYAYQMMSVISISDSFVNIAGMSAFMPRPLCRPLTKYERRGLKLGHQTWDLMFKRIRVSLEK